MASLISPGVITSEVDLSSVAPAISQTIAGIVGAARKGKPNKALFFSSPDDAVEGIGKPLLEEFGGHALVNYLKRANQAWFCRVGSLRGDDPIYSANTDTRAELTQTDATAFLVPSDIMALANPATKTLRLRFDADSSKFVNLTFTSAVLTSLIRSTLSDTINALSSWINGVLSSNGTAEPRLGYTTVVDGTPSGKKIKFFSQAKTGGLSKIDVMPPTTGADAAALFGFTSGVTSATGARTIELIRNLTAASIDSLAQGAGGYNLGAPAKITSALAQPYNLGEAAVATINNNDNSATYSPTVYSFTASMIGHNLAATNVLSAATLAILQAAPYIGINPVIQLVIDGYNVAFTVPVQTWAAPITQANLQAMVNAANAASPAGLGDYMFLKTTGEILIQAPGKIVGHSYIKIPLPQGDIPQGNAAAVHWIFRLLGLKWYDVKVQNQFTITSPAADSRDITFDYSTVTAYGFNPAAMTNSQVASLINQEWGSNIASVGTGMDVVLTSEYKGLDALTKFSGYNTRTASLDGYLTYLPGATNFYKNHATARFNFTNAAAHDTAKYNNVYLKFMFGATHYAIVRISDIAWATDYAAVPVGQIKVVSTSINASAAQKLAFETLVQAHSMWHIVKGPSEANGYQRALITGTDQNGGAGIWSTVAANTDLVVCDAGSVQVDTGVFTSNTAGTIVATAPVGETSSITGFVKDATGLPDLADVAGVTGVHLQSAAGGAAKILHIFNLYNHGDLRFYIDISTVPIIMVDANSTTHTVTGFDSTEAYATWIEKDLDIVPITAAQVGVVAGALAHAGGAITISPLNTSFVCTLMLTVNIGGTDYHGVVGIVPTATTWLQESLHTGSGLFALGLVYCPVTIVTLVQANGLDFAVAAGSYACLDYGATLQLKFSTGAISVGGNLVTAAVEGFLIGGHGLTRTFLAPTVMPSDSYGPTSLGTQTASACYRSSYNPSTAAFYTTSKGGLSDDDYGDGFSAFSFLVDNSFTVDLDFNNYVFAAGQSAATASETADAINARARQIDLSLDGVASVSSVNKVVLTSATKGSSSSLMVLADNSALNYAAYVGVPTNGTGYPFFSFKIDSGETYSIDFTEYAGDLILDQEHATALEVQAALIRATGISSTYITVTGIGVAAVVSIESVLTGISGTIQTFTANAALGNDFALISTFYGTETAVQCGTAYAVSPGTWANAEEDYLKIQFEDEDYAFFAPNTSKLTVWSNGEAVATYREVSPDPDADGTTGPSGQGVFIETVLGSLTNLVDDTEPNSWMVFEFDEDLVTSTPDYNGGRFKPGTYELSGGANGLDGLTQYDFIGVSYNATYGGPTGLQVFADKERLFVNVICAPGQSNNSVYDALVLICESRRDCAFLIDPPIGLRPTQVVDWHNGLGYGGTKALTSTYGMLEATWFSYDDPYNQQTIWLPPSALVLETLAYSDSISDPWFPAAGLTRGKIVGANDVQYSPNQGERDLMLGPGNSVNPIVNFSSDGLVIWGEKTLQRFESAVSRFSARRLMCYLSRVVELSSKLYIFEPNDQVTRNKLIESIGAVLEDVAARRGIVRFQVKDATKQFHINQKRMRILVYVEPSQSAEIIEVPFIIVGSGQAFLDVA
jgi:hypothetical protein